MTDQRVCCVITFCLIFTTMLSQNTKQVSTYHGQGRMVAMAISCILITCKYNNVYTECRACIVFTIIIVLDRLRTKEIICF